MRLVSLLNQAPVSNWIHEVELVQDRKRCLLRDAFVENIFFYIFCAILVLFFPKQRCEYLSFDFILDWAASDVTNQIRYSINLDVHSSYNNNSNINYVMI